MVNLPLNEWLLPLLGFIPIVVAVVKISKKEKVTKDSAFELIIGFLILCLSVNDNYNAKREHSDNSDSLTHLHAEIKNLTDTLRSTRDTLITIGLTIDDKTGKIQILDSQILKAVLKIQPTSAGLPDSVNYSVKRKNDTLYISPKEGTWVHGYIAFDTINSARFESMLNEGMGTANIVDGININGKIYTTHIFKMYDRAVYKGEPIRLRMSGDFNRYIIFGDEGIPSKRYFYKQGKVIWIPETAR